MPQFIYRNNLKYYKGNGTIPCHVDAIHATPPRADLFTDKIALGIMAQTRCAGIIGTVSRKKADLNKGANRKNDRAVQEYRESLQIILNHLGIFDYENHLLTKPYLHISIHGMKDDYQGPFGIEIGTRYGQSCSLEVRDWFREILRKKGQDLFPKLQIAVDQKFIGGHSIVEHRLGDGLDYPGYGPNFHTIHVEIARSLRENYVQEMVELLAHAVKKWRSLK